MLGWGESSHVSQGLALQPSSEPTVLRLTFTKREEMMKAGRVFAVHPRVSIPCEQCRDSVFGSS